MADNSTTEEPVLLPLWKELFRVAQDWEYGSTHTHKEIARILGIEYGGTDYYGNVNSAFEQLANIGKRLRCVHNTGYYVLKPSEYPLAAYDDTHKSGRILKRGLDNIHNAPVQKMDNSTKQRIEAIGTHMARTYVNLVTATNEVKELAGISRKQKMLAKHSNGKVD